MDVTRAQEIIRSKQKINVELEGTSVWIDEVDEQRETVRVHAETNPEEQKTVAVQELKEIH
jgi:small acid-soluble spore protein H (minor)